MSPIAEDGMYQGKPSLTLKWRADSQYPFSFGVTKARLILAAIDQIKAFVDRNPEQGIGNRAKQSRPIIQEQETQTTSDRTPRADDTPPC